MPTRPLLVSAALVLAAASAAAATAIVGSAEDGPREAKAFPSASAVNDAIRSGLPCAPMPVGGKYAGSAYDRCDLEGSPIDIRTDGFVPAGGDVLTGPNWEVHASPSDLRRVRTVIGGRIRDTPVRTDFSVTLDAAAQAATGASRGLVGECDALPGVGPAQRTGVMPVVLVPFAGDEQERDELRRCLEKQHGARVQELEPFQTNGYGEAAPLPGRAGGAVQHS